MIFALGNSSGGSGGPTASDAILTVTAPAGSTVTATKGSATLTPTMWTAAADATQECALFVIPAAQFDSSTPWTVTATSGTDTASDTVTIDSNKQYDVSLKYDLYFIENGVFKLTYTTYNMTANESSSGTVIFTGTGTYPKCWSQQLTAGVLNGWYSKLCADIVSYTGAANMYIGLSSNTSTSSSTPDLAAWTGKNITELIHVEIDLTNVQITNSYVKLGYSTAIQCIIKNLYLAM